MKWLSYDGWLSQAVQYIWKLIILNVCFVIGCIPVFTVGAASAALYACFMNDSCESSWAKRFWRAFAENFRQATLMWLIFLAIGAVLAMDILLLYAVEFPGSGLLQVVTAVIVVLYLSVACFAFSLQARYTNSLLGTLKNALVLGASMIVVGIVMALILLFPVLLFALSLDLFFAFLPFILLMGGSMAHNLNAAIMRRIFRKIQPPAEET